MKDQIELKGASGAAYRFRLAENGDPKTTISGNYVYVRAADGMATVLLVGDAANLTMGIHERWSEAVRDHGATHIFTRLNVSGVVRVQEQQDLIAGLRPVMNAAEV
ncbi:hypothetical protein BH11PSE2_BH11PSE2_07010 [soil metagenome]